MNHYKRSFSTLIFFIFSGVVFSACGVKGPPLPPLGKQDVAPRPSPSSSSQQQGR